MFTDIVGYSSMMSKDESHSLKLLAEHNRINFELPVDSHISMTIYNLQGRLITTLSDEIKSAGYHTITWNASQQASGIYFVKMYARDADMATIGMMTIESYLQIQKLMLVK